MNDEEFRLLDRIEDGHWWFVGKRRILLSLLGEDLAPQPMLDLGCGTGGVLRDWKGRRSCVGVDGSALALAICRKKGFSEVARGSLSELPFPAGTFGTVVALDVLEHIDDDVAFLRRAGAVCAPGGRFLISVPAFPLLWSQHDETFEHRRRYTAGQLERVVRAAGLEPERVTYTNTFVFPVAAVWRVLSYRLGLGRFAPKQDFWPVPRWLNALLIRAYGLEAWLLRRLDLPFGVSVVCIARAPGEARAV